MINGPISPNLLAQRHRVFPVNKKVHDFQYFPFKFNIMVGKWTFSFQFNFALEMRNECRQHPLFYSIAVLTPTHTHTHTPSLSPSPLTVSQNPNLGDTTLKHLWEYLIERNVARGRANQIKIISKNKKANLL